MTHAAIATLESIGSIPSPFAGIAAALEAARARHTARRGYRYLLEAEPHLLADIGLTRADVRQALMACDGR
jgi:uncharacterized protein YjiS (DUF1127 family)